MTLYAVRCPRTERPGTPATPVARTLDYRIGGASNPRGMEALLEWFRERGARRVRLTASAQADPMYVSMGFAPEPDPLLELRL
ncbi:hypothetical protein [Streptomyces sp. AC602_WCS936]|uniref:hypothetical protein n=1 Tax=Streptomyces sp. AC602_WCS936 TaxID=2823685 RepID=UPI0035B36F99